MAVSAAAFVMSASAFAAVAVAIAATVAVASAAATATTATGEGVEGLLEFFVGGFVSIGDVALEVEFFASVNLVEVENDGAVFDFDDKTVEAHAVFVHEGDDVAGINGVVSEFAVDAEHVLADFDDAFGIVRAVALFDAEGEVEGVASVEFGNVALEGFEAHAEVGDELEGVFGGCLFEEFMDAGFVVGVEVVSDCDIAVGHIR